MAIDDIYKQSPALWCQRFVSITSTKGGRVPFDLYDYQFDLLSDRAPQRAVLKARQTGMSQTFAAEALHTARFQEGATVLFVSRSLDAAINLLDYCKDILVDLDDGADIRVTKKGSTRLGFSNGSRIMSVPATQSTGRTYAATKVYLDEGAFLPWADMIYTAVSPTVARGGQITVGSTPNGQGNFFHALIELQQYGPIVPYFEYDGLGWSYHRIHWSDCPAYDQRWFEDNRPKYSEASWYSEFECDFEKSGQPVFRSGDVQAMQEGWREAETLGKKGRQYVTAWDIGRRRDATVGITIDVTEPVHQIVKIERVEATPIPVIQSMILRRFHQFPGTHIVEANDKGDAVIENIDVPEGAIEPFWTNLMQKRNIITSLQWALESQMLKCDVKGQSSDSLMRTHGPRLAQELVTYQWDDRYIVQDMVMALAIAEHKYQWREESQEVYYDAEYTIGSAGDYETISVPDQYGWDLTDFGGYT